MYFITYKDGYRAISHTLPSMQIVKPAIYIAITRIDNDDEAVKSLPTPPTQ